MKFGVLVPLTLVPLLRVPIPGAEIPAYDRATGRLFVTSARDVHAFELCNGSNARGVGFARLGQSGDDVTHVAADPAGRGFLAACLVPERFASQFGHVVFFDPLTLREVARVATGHNPDSCAFTPGGEFLVVANEGQAQVLPTGEIVDPPGSVTVIDLRRVRSASDLARLGDADVAELMLHGPAIDMAVESERPPRISERNRRTPALDLEPEYVTSPDNQWAFVSLQENNAVLRIRLDPARIDAFLGLGLVEREIDASDRDGSLGPAWAVSCAPMPDQIAALRSGGTRYLVMAEEGDVRGDADRDGTGVGDAARIGDLVAWGVIGDDVVSAEDAAPERLGRLNVLADSAMGWDEEAGTLIVPGARSIGVYDAETMRRVGDTGSDFEIAAASLFGDDSRSDDRGPEPEGVIVATFGDRPFAFVSLERPGAVAVVDLAEPAAPRLISVHPSAWEGDLGPEGMCLIERSDGAPILVVCYETSGTVVFYEVTGGTGASSR